ncbi:MAG: YeeE/YedE family protein [Gammaproteobacteria bacterium]|nr:YeeE/YedE family protein [Gammaproteobacteria bacterium]MDP6537716.1 YeeE/YedE family protein [Gammaproteobacteria bacterium]MDP6734410.1 YeeE/YedE family protein [Gammaproteobacteria bacterium]
MNSDSTLTPSPTDLTLLTRNRRTIGVVAILSALMFLYLSSTYGWRQGALFVVGLAAGVILYHAAFGFTSAWREVVNTGRGAGLRAQMIMLAVTVLVFTPLIAWGEVFGTSIRGSVAPVNVAVICGAFMFGLGMQLGGGCASGTLFTAGGGNVRMLITLAGFILGSLIGTWQWPMWQGVPGFAPVSLTQNFGVIGGILISLTLFAAVYYATVMWERRRHGDVVNEPDRDAQFSWLHGPWPLIAGALALVLVQLSTLLLAGRPWGVTAAFALWGAKMASVTGLDVTTWAYWQRPGSLSALNESIFNDITSVMNIGIMLGALMAAGLAYKFSPKFKLPMGAILASVLGGLLLGYGARIAFGCNIGAYFSGIGSTSLHGWLWFAAAFAGSTLGTRIRPWFGLS